MNTTVRRGAVVVLLMFSAACGSSGPTSPSGSSQPPSLLTPPTLRPQIDFPPLSGPSRSFIFDGELTYLLRSADPNWRRDVSDYTKQSRFVLYENGAFGLQYPSIGAGGYEYRGQYQKANGVIMFLFEFQGRSVGTPWDDATGTLEGNLLTVQYHEQMKHADFENAVYVLTQDLPAR
jgi:hypothetical protein